MTRTDMGLGARSRALLLIAAGSVLLAACGDKSGDKPTGQVVARLGGEDITQLEVNAELQGSSIPPNMQRRDAEKMALQNIVTRRMLANAAREQKVDQSPQFLMTKRRAEEQLYVQALARDIAGKVPQPGRDEVDKFISENPSLFRERKFFLFDQIQFLRPDDMAKLDMESASTMDQVEQRLSASGIEYRRQPGSLDALGANPDFIREVTSVLERNPNELFMFTNPPVPGQRPVVVVNQVRETRVMPFTGEKAREYAQRFLHNQRIQKTLQAEVLKQQAAAKEQVTYQEGWGPPAKPNTDPAALAGAKAKGTSNLPSPTQPATQPGGELGVPAMANHENPLASSGANP